MPCKNRAIYYAFAHYCAGVAGAVGSAGAGSFGKPGAKASAI